jgi:hypothetical protein
MIDRVDEKPVVEVLTLTKEPLLHVLTYPYLRVSEQFFPQSGKNACPYKEYNTVRQL